MSDMARTSHCEQFCARIIMMKVAHPTYPEHLHQQYEMLLALEGCIEVIVEDEIYHASAGDLVFINSGCMHACYSDSSAKAQIYGFFPQQVPQFSECISNIRFHSLMASTVIGDETVRTLIQEWSGHKDSVNLALQTNLLLSQVLSAAPSQAQAGISRRYPQPLRDALSFISERLPDDITLNMLAEHTSASPYHLSHLFAKVLGVSFPDYIAIMRINAARRMLVQTELSIAEIARRCGYANNRTFNRNFIRVSGITPSEYREVQSESSFVDYDLPFVNDILCRRYAALQSATKA